MTTERDLFTCKDCKVDTNRAREYYMVHDALWRKARGGRGMLCVGCLETRIGRRLTADDFTTAPVNSIWPASPRLKRRRAAWRRTR